MFVASNQAKCKKCGDVIWSANRHIIANVIGVMIDEDYIEFTKLLCDGETTSVGGVEINNDMLVVFEREIENRPSTNNWGLMLAMFRDLRDFFDFGEEQFAKLQKEETRRFLWSW